VGNMCVVVIFFLGCLFDLIFVSSEGCGIVVRRTPGGKGSLCVRGGETRTRTLLRCDYSPWCLK
jgi:hypothetical protein